MNWFLKAPYYLLLLVWVVGLASDFHLARGMSDLDDAEARITTEVIEIDFSAASEIQTLTNAVQNKHGIQVKNTRREAHLSFEPFTMPLDTLEPFLAFGSRWVSSPGRITNRDIHLEIRHASAAQQWSGWERVALDEHLTTAADTSVGELKFLPATTEYMQFRFILNSSNQTEPVRLRSILLSFTSPGSTSPKLLEKLRSGRKEKKSADTVRGKPGQPYPMPDFMSRTDWDCPDGQQPSGPVVSTDVTHQIVHHSAGPNSSSDWPAVVRAIWDYHVNTNNWSDIGYNWLVDPNGIIYQGRGWIAGNDEVQGAHFCGTNSNTMGACLLGNFEESEPAAEALASLEDLLAWKSDEKGIDPLAQEYHPSSGLQLNTISGHRDGCSTLCPGEFLYAELPQIRNNVDMLIGETEIVENDMESVTSYPNPFSVSTNITFNLDEASRAEITIWDLTGRQVYKLADRLYESGEHTVTWNTAGQASGIYFCRIKLDEQIITRKLMLVR